jgi:5-methylcytosine-specific restriction endonuclease McrA
MKRRNWTALQRLGIFMSHGGVCHLCDSKILMNEKWDLEHVIPLAMGGDDDEENLRPAHKACHKAKTKDDVKAVAKAKRRQAKHLGAKASKHKWQSRPFASGYSSNVKQLRDL